jgi:hypothetical protein
MLWQSAPPGTRSPRRLGVLFRAQTCRFDETHIKLGNPLTGGQNCIRHSGTAETGIILDRLNRRDNLWPVKLPQGDRKLVVKSAASALCEVRIHREKC